MNLITKFFTWLFSGEDDSGDYNRKMLEEGGYMDSVGKYEDSHEMNMAIARAKRKKKLDKEMEKSHSDCYKYLKEKGCTK